MHGTCSTFIKHHQCVELSVHCHHCFLQDRACSVSIISWNHSMCCIMNISSVLLHSSLEIADSLHNFAFCGIQTVCGLVHHTQYQKPHQFWKFCPLPLFLLLSRELPQSPNLIRCVSRFSLCALPSPLLFCCPQPQPLLE